jgi:hypothetical protein
MIRMKMGQHDPGNIGRANLEHRTGGLPHSLALGSVQAAIYNCPACIILKQVTVDDA